MRSRTRGTTPSTLSWRQLLALVLLFVVTSFSFVLLDRGRLLDPLKGLVDGPLHAVADRFVTAGEGVRGIGERFGNVGELRAENKRLEVENQRLRAAEARVDELERENQQLIDQANFASKFPRNQLLPARVISRDPRSREKFFVINRGADHGIQVGMPAVSPNFLVGVVTEVSPKSAKVRLIIDEGMQLGVQLQTERTHGVLYGRWQQGGRLTVKHIDRDVGVPQGAVIITSGLTGRVPEGLLVGYAINAKKDEQNDAQQFDVVPYVDFDALEAVTIILTGEG